MEETTVVPTAMGDLHAIIDVPEAAVAGVVAAIGPARSAANVDVLEAVVSD